MLVKNWKKFDQLLPGHVLCLHNSATILGLDGKLQIWFDGKNRYSTMQVYAPSPEEPDDLGNFLTDMPAEELKRIIMLKNMSNFRFKVKSYV